MGLDNGLPPDLLSSKKGNVPSTWWFVALAFVIVANLLVWFYPPVRSFEASIFSVLSVVVLASSRAFKQYRRLVYLMVVPGLFALTLVGHGFHWLVTSRCYNGPGAELLQALAGGPQTQVLVSVVIGLLAGILVPFLVLEGYVFMHQDVVQGFSGLDTSAVRRILRSLFFNLNRPYFMVKDGEVSQTRPPGLALIGGPGLVVVTPGNAVVFERGGKLTRVELGGIHPTKKYERIYKVIRLNPRSNYSASPTPTYPTPAKAVAPTQATSKEGRNVRDLQTKDGIYLNLDLNTFFQIKRKKEAIQDRVLAEFAAQKVKDLPDAYIVDKEDVFKAATEFNHWELAVSEIAEDVLRNVIGRHTLDELLKPAAPNEPPEIRGRICREVEKQLNEIVGGYGIEVTYMSIGGIDIPADVHAQIQERWMAENRVQLAQKQREVALLQSQSQADSMEIIETARARAQNTLVDAVSAAFEQHQGASRAFILFQFIQALESIAKDPSTKLLLPFGLPLRELVDMVTNQGEWTNGPQSTGEPPQLPAGPDPIIVDQIHDKRPRANVPAEKKRR